VNVAPRSRRVHVRFAPFSSRLVDRKKARVLRAQPPCTQRAGTPRNSWTPTPGSLQKIVQALTPAARFRARFTSRGRTPGIGIPPNTAGSIAPRLRKTCLSTLAGYHTADVGALRAIRKRFAPAQLARPAALEPSAGGFRPRGGFDRPRRPAPLPLVAPITSNRPLGTRARRRTAAPSLDPSLGDKPAAKDISVAQRDEEPALWTEGDEARRAEDVHRGS
jgi:hypothetical protein